MMSFTSCYCFESIHFNFRKNFQNFLNRHAPQKNIRGNHALFMTKDLSKAVMNKSKTRNRHLK